MSTPTLEEAARKLSNDLVKYAGTDGWHAVGYVDDLLNPHLIIYTTTRKRANDLLAFIGYSQDGYKGPGEGLPVSTVTRP